MGYVPFLSDLNLALAHVADAPMTQKDGHARLGADPDSFHWTDSPSLLQWQMSASWNESIIIRA